MPSWSRADALLAITSPLGVVDALIPTRLTAHEEISQPFSFEVEAVSQIGAVEPDTLLNQALCVILQASGKPVRYFHGVVQGLRALGKTRGETDGEFFAYRLTLAPRLWFLNQTTDCRVFQQKSTSDILTTMFQEAGMPDFEMRVTGSLSPREYTIQFNESDLTFAQRLMEEDGLFYFFEHAASTHKLIITDNNQAFVELSEVSLLLQGADADDNLVQSWSRPHHTARGKMKFKDYDPVKPGTLLEAEESTTLTAGGAATRDDFLWPAHTFQNAAVKKRAKNEMEAAEAEASLSEGMSYRGQLVAGGRFKIASKPQHSSDDTYIVRAIDHTAVDETWMNQGIAAMYENSFSCFPSKKPWRQHMVTPRPRIDGVHAAIVLGEEEIFTDDLARVKVKFFWDHRGEATSGGSVWARVIQPWAGPGFGGQFIPRRGTEVAVAFVDGDPDRPIVIGGLYNGQDAPIYSKSDRTKSGFRTKSLGGGGKESEFTFDDASGKELVYLRAMKDHTIEVKNDRKLTVEDGNDTIEVSKGNISIKAVKGKIEVEAAQSIKLTVGPSTLELTTSSIKLAIGASTLELTASGIKLDGVAIKITGKATADLTSPMTTVNADAILTLKGAVVMIN